MSDASNLNMSNSPWHYEVVEGKFSVDYAWANGGGGGGGGEEEKKECGKYDNYYPNKKWRTWIDYEKFNELSEKHRRDEKVKFGVMDYLADTPKWATFGNNAEGFDPTDKRFRKKGKIAMYTKYDEEGVPTHDSAGRELEAAARKGLEEEMRAAVREYAGGGGRGGEVENGKGGERKVKDLKLMFRGLVVVDKEERKKNDLMNDVGMIDEKKKMKLARSWE